MSLAPGTTLTCCSLLVCPGAEAAGFGAGAAAFAPGIAAAFTAGAGAPGAGLAACCCCSDFTVLRALSMAEGFCAHIPPAIIAIATMPVVSFICGPYFFAAGVPGFAPAPAAEGVKS